MPNRKIIWGRNCEKNVKCIIRRTVEEIESVQIEKEKNVRENMGVVFKYLKCYHVEKKLGSFCVVSERELIIG